MTVFFTLVGLLGPLPRWRGKILEVRVTIYMYMYMSMFIYSDSIFVDEGRCCFSLLGIKKNKGANRTGEDGDEPAVTQWLI